MNYLNSFIAHWNSKNRSQFLPFIGLLVFAIALLVLDELFTGWLQTRRIMWMVHNELTTDRPVYAYLSFILSFFAWVVYCWAAFRAIRPIRGFLWVFMIMAVFIEYGYMNTFNRYMTGVDFWTAVFSPWSLWMEAIGMYFNSKALIITLLFSGVVIFNWKKPHSTIHPEIILLIFFIGNWALRTYLPFERAMGISVFQYVRLLEDIRISDRFLGTRKEVPTNKKSTLENNIILVIDESVRADHLSINNYSRNTTPTLLKLSEKGLLTNWGSAAASATCTIYSNPHILTGVSSAPGVDSRLTSYWPTVFQYAQSMGYRTYYLDAQENYLWNGMSTGDLKYVDIYQSANKFGGNIYSDEEAARYIREEILNSTGNFIVLNKLGVHVIYENDYPPSEARWFPIRPDNNNKNIQSMTINAYDNAVHFNLESFFKTLMPDMEPLPHTVLLYTSDHGQTLQEHGETWSHCHNSAPEANVPLFILGRINPVPDTQYHASHMNILPTLLDLMDVPQEFRKEQYAPSLFIAERAMNQPRFFLDGDLMPVQFNIQ